MMTDSLSSTFDQMRAPQWLQNWREWQSCTDNPKSLACPCCGKYPVNTYFARIAFFYCDKCAREVLCEMLEEFGRLFELAPDNGVRRPTKDADVPRDQDIGTEVLP
jgi:hypothetical protein